MRVQVNLSDDLVAKIDHFADRIGLSRSAVCAYWIGRSYVALETGEPLFEDSLDNLYTAIEFRELDK